MDPQPEVAPANEWGWWCTACCRPALDGLTVGADGVVYAARGAGGCGHVLVMFPLPQTPDARRLGCSCPNYCRVVGHARAV